MILDRVLKEVDLPPFVGDSVSSDGT